MKNHILKKIFFVIFLFLSFFILFNRDVLSNCSCACPFSINTDSGCPQNHANGRDIVNCVNDYTCWNSCGGWDGCDECGYQTVCYWAGCSCGGGGGGGGNTSPSPTPTPYLVIRVKDTNGNSRLAEKMALTYSCSQDIFCKASQEVTLTSEHTFPYTGGSNKGGGIVLRSFHKLLGVTPVPNTGGSLYPTLVPCNGINCPETWQNYWWNNFPDTGQASLDYVVYVYPTPSLGKLIIKAQNTRDSASGPYGFSGKRKEESSQSNVGVQLGRNQYNYMVVGQVINSNISSSQNFNLDPKANIGLGGVIFGPRGSVTYNLDNPASILSIVRNSKGFIMLYAEKSISKSGRKHLLVDSIFTEIQNDHVYLYVPKNNSTDTDYHWVKMRNTPESFHIILRDNKQILKLGPSGIDSCYEVFNETTSVPCFKVYFYSGFLSHQQKEVYGWGTYGYVYDHLRDRNFIEYRSPNQN